MCCRLESCCCGATSLQNGCKIIGGVGILVAIIAGITSIWVPSYAGAAAGPLILGCVSIFFINYTGYQYMDMIGFMNPYILGLPGYGPGIWPMESDQTLNLN